MKDLNTVTVIGRMTKAPELKTSAAGVNFCNFSIANNRDYKKDGQEIKCVNFINCTAWSSLAEIICKYGEKGKQVCVSGELVQRSWEDQSGQKHSAIEIKISEFQLLSGGSGNGAKQDNDAEPQFI